MDTGSRDRTRSIARSLGAQVFQTEWKDDYSAPRNELIQKATQPWILFLDADQRISVTDVKKLRAMIAKSEADVFLLPHRNYTNDYNLLSGWTRAKGQYPFEERLAKACGYYSDFRPCLFRNLPGAQYSFQIHETIQPAIDRFKWRTSISTVVVHHFEFKKGLKHHHRKHHRYLKAEAKLLQSISRKSGNYFRLMENAVVDSISCRKGLNRANQWCARLLAHNPKNSAYWMHSARIAILQSKGKLAQAILRRGLRHCKTPDLSCLLAWLLYRSGDHGGANRYVKQALWLDRNHLVSLNLKAMILAEGMQLRASLRILERALRLHPQYSDAQFNRGVVNLSLGKRVRARIEFRKLLSRPIDQELKQNIHTLLKKTGSGSP